MLLFGVEVEFGLVVLLGLVEVLLELELGEVELLPLELDGEVEFMSELLLLEDGEVVEEGEVELLEPVWLEDVDGLLCELLVPLPAPEPSLLVPVPLALLCAMAIPVEKITAVAIVRSFLLIRVCLPERWLASFTTLDGILRSKFAMNRE